jgi:oxygen-independent coproporphyrinogen-3 oxidase
MIGLGCGARSYTRRLHYATEYAVGRPGVRAILDDYVTRPDSTFEVADYGCRLNGEEERRRYVIKSLLRCEGLSSRAYRRRFESDPWEDLPELHELERLGLAEARTDRLCLTESGLERSDAVGPWLYSHASRARMEAFELR